jgi:hypothetical protein
MLARRAALIMLAGVAAASGLGCQQAAKEPKPYRDPYPECRSIIEWIRVRTRDPEAQVIRWGPREKLPSEPGEEEVVIIEARYRAEIEHVSGVWSQKFRVQNKRISDASGRTQEDDPKEDRGASGEKKSD